MLKNILNKLFYKLNSLRLTGNESKDDQLHLESKKSY